LGWKTSEKKEQKRGETKGHVETKKVHPWEEKQKGGTLSGVPNLDDNGGKEALWGEERAIRQTRQDGISGREEWGG